MSAAKDISEGRPWNDRPANSTSLTTGSLSSAAASAEWRTATVTRPAGHHARLWYWMVTSLWLLILTYALLFKWSEVASRLPQLVWWVLILSLIALLPVRRGRALMTADTAMLTAAAMLLTPVTAGLTAFAGSLDKDEFTGGRPWSQLLYNRSQSALSTFSASLVTHSFVPKQSNLALVFAKAGVALIVLTIINYLLVGPAIAALHECSFLQALRRMRVGSLSDYTLTFIVWGLFAGIVAILYDRLNGLALLIFLGPTILTRQGLIRSQMYIESDRALRLRDLAVSEIAQQALSERTDERRLIAADLHDEVLQPLYKVTLLAHVLRMDLARGSIADLAGDLPDLAEAADLASATVRSMIGALRESTLGRGGLAPSLTRLVEMMSSSSRVELKASVSGVEADPATELALYQIAKEALGNSLAHAGASQVSLRLIQSEDAIVLIIADDGIGFDPSVQKEGHFGLHIMRERASSVGADLYLDSAPGEGTRITVSVSKPPRRDA
jgi:signal transduction histidine kinase